MERDTDLLHGPCVLSVSPRDADDAAGGGSAAPDVLLVIRQLTDQATASARHLERLLQRAGQFDAAAARASCRLQERLRVGAQLLQAQRGQVERTEELLCALAEAERSARSRVERLERQIALGCEEVRRLEREARTQRREMACRDWPRDRRPPRRRGR
ncbi:MAG: hypothetical protein ACYTGC_13830 [Planctomycetota bacterium]|jgi:hypothetical protein